MAIKVEALGKRYRIGQTVSYRTLRDTLMHIAAWPFRFMSPNGPAKPSTSDIFWALRDVSFQVQRGEVLGIIGRNGAGKSTCLKILSRITEPTEGRIEITGRVGSLLEVGTGFHPELTGRENTFLNGAILGMTRTEVKARFDEIIAFAEIEKFIDTPVKRYSSGMYTRLAFAVAAHLEPDILIVDEVLAVGDVGFQKKCLGKMQDVASHGRTVLFVSHNMAAIQNMCDRALVLDQGRVLIDTTATKGIEAYIENNTSNDAGSDLAKRMRPAKFSPIIRKVEFLDHTGKLTDSIRTGGALTIRIHYQHTQPITDPYFGIGFESTLGVKLIWVQTRMQMGQLPTAPAQGVVECRIPRLCLVPDLYFINFGCGTQNHQLDLLDQGRQLQVIESDYYGTGRLPKPRQSLLLIDAEWKIPNRTVSPRPAL